MLNHFRGIVPIIGFLVVWEFSARAGFFPPVLFPPFSTVVVQWITLLGQGTLSVDVATSMLRAASGLALAIAGGVTIGLAMARIRSISWFFEPLIAIGFPMPTITLIPIFIVWFGIGHASKILLIALTCFFPIAISTASGARQVDQYIIWSAQAMGTSKRQVFWRVILPAALPFIFSGVRITLPVSLIIGFVAEMVGGGGGLGYTLVYAYRFLETPTVFATLLTVLVLGFLLDRMLLFARKRLLPWNTESGTE